MEKYYKPRWKHLITNSLMGNIVLVITICLLVFHRAGRLVYIILLIVLIIVSVFFKYIEFYTYNDITFSKDHLTITKGFFRRKKISIEYGNIISVYDFEYPHFPVIDTIFIKYGIKKKIVPIYHSFLSNEEFRDIHTMFIQILPKHKVLFRKGYCNLDTR